ncbi:MAG: signal peptide peptidase SppA [Desulfovibrionales bacterium]
MNEENKTMQVRIKRGPADWIKTAVGVLFLIIIISFFFFQPEQPTQWEYLDEGLGTMTTAPEIGEETAVIGMLDLNGIILNKAFAPSGVLQTQTYITPEQVRRELNAFQGEDLDALLVKITTPGGSVAASDELARLIQVFSEESVPVIVYTSSLLASGGYYMAAPADAIYSAPQAMVGSIGVLFQAVNAQELMEDKLGVQVRIFKEGRFKDLGSPFKELTPAEEEVINEQINDAYEAFLQTILDGREISRERLTELATGRVFTGNEAAEKKLVDGAMYMDQLMRKMKSDLNKQELVFLRYKEPVGLLGQLFLGRRGSTARELVHLFDPLSRFTLPSGLYYLMDG